MARQTIWYAQKLIQDAHRGSFDKRIVAEGPKAVKAELARLAPVIRDGGFVPGIDHSSPADVSWDNYRRYIDLLVKAAVEGVI